MIREWINSEHHRLHIVEKWPVSLYKDAVMVAIQSSLARLSQGVQIPPVCAICMSKNSLTSKH